MAEITDDLAAELIGKVQAFLETLSAAEREMFAVLIGPGVEALQGGAATDEVHGFELGAPWEADSLRGRLAQAAQNSGIEIVYRRD